MADHRRKHQAPALTKRAPPRIANAYTASYWSKMSNGDPFTQLSRTAFGGSSWT